MSFKNNNRFDRFSHFDPESKLSEFRKNFFQNPNKMFADSNRWPNGADRHSMSKNAKTDSNPFEEQNEGIPIKVVHQRTDDSFNTEPNDEMNRDSMSSFGSSQSQRSNDTSNSGGSVFSNRSQDSGGGEPRVYHIPITVEPRDGSTSSGYTSEANVSTEQPLSRSSSHSSAHSVGSTRSHNRSFSPANTSSDQLNTSTDKKGRQIPIQIETSDKQRTTPPPKESLPNVQSKGTAQHKFKPKSGPFVTRIPVVNQSVDPPQMKESTPEPDSTSEPNIITKVDPLVRINEVLSDLKKYENEVNHFEGKADDKNYRFLDEMLTRCMIKLDTIETDGIEEVRRARKAAVLAVNQCIALLESKVDKSQTNVNTDQKQSTQSEEPMKTSTPEPTHQQMKPQTIESNQSESQMTDNTQQMTTTENNSQNNDSQQNGSQIQSSDKNPTNESHRKETAV